MKPSIPKGTRDFLPDQVIKRNYLFKTIKTVFENFAYVPIETPSFETLNVLTGKYGEEGDRLLFKILNNGDFISDVDQRLLDDRDSKKLVSEISKRGLRYDLTVPFARFVVMHENDLYFPFKRYQIQPVWRADRPQKGRYQEFYQCDADAIGSDSLMYEAELMCIYDQVFSKLNIPVVIRINNRKVLEDMVNVVGHKDKFMEITIILDKIDKIGWDGVENELFSIGLEIDEINSIKEFIELKNIEELSSWFDVHNIDSIGLEEITEVFNYLKDYEFSNELKFDPVLARGLNYYTGCIFEVNAIDAKIGSLGGGGRYAELTEVFDKKGMSGVGISFGAERIYDVMEENNLFPAELFDYMDILIITMDKDSHMEGFKLVSRLRENNIRADLYPVYGNMKKQMKYANAINVPYVGIIGSEELEAKSVLLKEMETGDQDLMKTQCFHVKFGETLMG
ncbi:MAG: histidine--tRNA ligase [Saprospiraceae bacterium]